MTYVLTDGPPDVDASHAWAPASGMTPPVINDWTADPITYPFIELKGITGWRSAPEADDIREPRTGRSGETPRPGFKRGKTIIYQMEVQADSREDLRSTLTGLLNGFADPAGLGTMTVTPFSSIDGIDWTYQARVLAIDADPAFTYNHWLQGPWRVGVTITLRMVDARFYADEVAVDEVADGDTFTVTNDGPADTDPVIVVAVPDSSLPTDVSLVNLESGILAFHLPAHTTLLTVNFAARTCVATVGIDETVDARQYLDVPASSWWDEFAPGLKSGDNDIAVLGGSWTATFRPATW